MTGQVHFDRYVDAGAFVAADLVNRLIREPSGTPTAAVLADILAIDPPSVAKLDVDDAPGFVALAHRLDTVFDSLRRGDLDAAATELNALLASHSAHPHLAKENGEWRMHHHPADAAVLPMWTSICSENLARLIGAGESARIGTCAGSGCERVFLDESKNASRRFCSTTCNNRARSAAYRRRHTRR